MTTLLVDGTNLTMQGIFAMRRSNLSAHGVPTGPLMVSINSFSKLVQQVQPDRMLVCWDGGRSRMRVDIDPDYKANRTPITDSEREFRDSSFDLVKRFVKLAGMAQQESRQVEADDLIAGAWANLTSRAEPERIVIASSDKDFLQLLGANPDGVLTEQHRFGAEDKPWTEERVIGELGCTPAQLPLVMALTGDKVDGVPGIPGLGPKRALKLLEDSDWDADAVGDHLDGKGLSLRERFEMNRKLVNLRDADSIVAVPKWSPPEPGTPPHTALVEFLEQFALESVLKRLRSGALWVPFGAEHGLPGRSFRSRQGR